MTHPTSSQLGLHLAWKFDQVLPGTFARNRAECAGKVYSIVGPLPPNGPKQLPIQGKDLAPPFLYFIYDGWGEIKYIGKAVSNTLKSPLDRWIRPGTDGRHYWSHGTNERKPTVDEIAKGISSGEGPYLLHFSNYHHFYAKVRERALAVGRNFERLSRLAPEIFIQELEQALVYRLQTAWNKASDRTRSPAEDLDSCSGFWL